MYNIEFYENQSGESELWNFLEKLRNEAATNKDSRIQYKQMMFYIELLQNNGTRLGENITKHLDNEIWELRPGTNRVFYFFITYVKKIDSQAKKDMEEMEELAVIVGAIIEKRTALGISQRDLADMCGIPQSSVARIETFKTTPKIDTLLKIMQPLGLKLTVSVA